MVASKIDSIMARLEGQAPVATPTSYAHNDTKRSISSPIPAFSHPQFSIKDASVSPAKREIEAYLWVWKDPRTGDYFIDAYNDQIVETAFDATIAELKLLQSMKNTPGLCPNLFNHKKDDCTGHIKSFVPDRLGMIYVAKIAQTSKGDEILSLCSDKCLGSSFGYDTVDAQILPMNIRRLKAVKLHEVSQVTFPANYLSPILSVKNTFTSYPTYSHEVPQELRQQPQDALSVASLVREMTQVGKPLKPNGEMSVSDLVAEMQKIGPSSPVRSQQKSNYQFYPVVGSNACLQLNPDDSVSLLNCDGISSDIAVALALALLRLDDFLDSFEPQPDSQYAPTTEGDIIAARRIWDMKADFKWRKRKAEEAKRTHWG